MRIGINARRLEGQRLGVGRYIEYLLRHWRRMVEPSDNILVYLREPLTERDPLLDGNTSIRPEVLAPALTGLAWESTILRRAARNDDVLFGPSYTLPLFYRGKTVVAIHSVNEIQSDTHPWWYRFTYSPLYRRSALRADRVIVPSRSTLEDIETYYGIPAQKLVVVPLGADDAFRPVRDEDLLQATRRKYLGSDRPYVVFVGKLSQRRNIPTLIRAFAEAKRRADLPHALLLFGPNHLNIPLRPIAEDAGVADSVLQDDGAVSDHSDLALVYNAADLFVSASTYEGFSLPLVEALACGCPTAVVNSSALAEIAGDASLLVDEPSVAALADAIERALTDDQLRTDLGTRGLERARQFRWEQTARQTLDVLRAAALN